MSGLINVYGNLAMHGSLSVRDDGTSFPDSPRVGQFALKDGVLFVYALLDGNKTWYPLTNERNAYVHVQGLANTQWNIGHGFGSEDLIYVVYDQNNIVQQVSADFIDENNLQLSFTEATYGKCVVFCATETFAQAVTTNLIEVGSIVIAGSAISVNGTDIVAIVNNLGTAAFADIGTSAGTVAAGDHTQAISTVVGLQTALNLKEDRSNKGVAGGYASLDGSGLIPVSQLPDTAKEIQVVSNIVERDALTPYSGLRVHVLDATSDPSVEGTWAEYLYATDTWVKTSEADSIDVVLNWADIENKPVSTTANIDAAVAQRHVHSNKAVLDGTEEAFTTLQKLKLETIATGATNYVHPASHPAEMIVITDTLQFVSNADKTAWNAKLDAATYTGADILSKLKVVDGPNSGLDADLLDGQDSSFFAPASHLHDDRYLQLDSKAADSNLLDGHDSTYFSIDGHTHSYSDLTDLTTILDTKQDELTSESVVPVSTITVSDSILPAEASTQTIGSEALPFASAYIDELHLSTNTLYLGDTPVLGTDQDTVQIKADVDQGITLRTYGTGESKVISANGVEVSTSGMNGLVAIQSTGAGGQVSLGATQAINLTAPETNVTGDLDISGHATFSTATFTGNVTFSGTSTTVNSTNVSTADNIITLNQGEVGAGVTQGKAGLQIDRGTSADIFFVYDEVDDQFKFGPTEALETVPALSYVQSELATKVDAVAGKGLSTNDFTDDLVTKLEAIAPGATNYVHPTYSGVDLSAVQSTLSGANVISGVNISVTSDINGHVTGATSSFNTRPLTPSDIGALSLTGTAMSANKLANPRTIGLSGDCSGSVVFDGTQDATISVVVANDSHNHNTLYYTKSEADTRFLEFNDKAADANLLDGHDSTYFAPQATTYTKSETDAAIAALVSSAPATLDTLNEIAAALGDDPNFATTITTQIGNKLDSSAYTAGDVLTKLKTVDGSGSGLDADLLDGHDSSHFLEATANAVSATTAASCTGNAATATTAASCTGNAATATKLATARTLALSGDVTGSVSFDGSANATIVTTIADDSHNHTIANVEGLQTALDGKLSTSGKAADANLLDGIDSASFLRSDVDDILTSAIIVPTANRDEGIFGTYESSKTQHIWSMGTAYRNAADGSSFGNLYGLAYKYNSSAGGHGVYLVNNGTALSGMGTGLWTAGNITAYSDERVKTNIQVIDNALDKISQISGYTFDRTDSDVPRQTGVIAQELIKVLPEAVVLGETEDDMMSVAYGNIVGLLIEGIKEQDAKIDAQQAQIDELRNMVMVLSNNA